MPLKQEQKGGCHEYHTKDLYENAVFALFDQLTDVKALQGERTVSLAVTGDDRPDLMVNWLRELLFFWTGEEKLVKKTAIQTISETELSADISFDIYSPDLHQIKHDIKAVTYHQIQVEETQGRWEARIIFDV